MNVSDKYSCDWVLNSTPEQIKKALESKSKSIFLSTFETDLRQGVHNKLEASDKLFGVIDESNLKLVDEKIVNCLIKTLKKNPSEAADLRTASLKTITRLLKTDKRLLSKVCENCSPEVLKDVLVPHFLDGHSKENLQNAYFCLLLNKEIDGELINQFTTNAKIDINSYYFQEPRITLPAKTINALIDAKADLDYRDYQDRNLFKMACLDSSFDASLIKKLIASKASSTGDVQVAFETGDFNDPEIFEPYCKRN